LSAILWDFGDFNRQAVVVAQQFGNLNAQCIVSAQGPQGLTVESYLAVKVDLFDNEKDGLLGRQTGRPVEPSLDLDGPQ
jgi:hypothetical protein